MDPATREVLGVAQGAVGGEPRAGAAADWAAEAIPQAVGRVREAVAAFVRDLGAADALVQDVRLAISEALSNAVIHAYPDHSYGRLEVHAHSDRASGLLTLRARTTEPAFAPAPTAPASESASRS